MTVLNRKVKQSINAVMKEHRSLSVGSLPTNIMSHIMKTSQNDYLKKGEHRTAGPMFGQEGSSEWLNQISELPEEYEKMPACPTTNTPGEINDNDENNLGQTQTSPNGNEDGGPIEEAKDKSI